MKLALDPRVRVFDGGRTLLGGDPWRVLRLTERGAVVLRRLLEGGVDPGGAGVAGEAGVASAALGRRLVAAGLAHPRPERGPTGAVTVVIPVRDRATELERCLTAVFAADAPGRVVVVDDGSRDPAAVAAVCGRFGCFGCSLIVREVSGGPAAARNTALTHPCVDSPLVALLDSDCVPEPGWLSVLCGALAADPGLGAVAPRVRCWEGLSCSSGQTFPASPARPRWEPCSTSGRGKLPSIGALARSPGRWEPGSTSGRRTLPATRMPARWPSRWEPFRRPRSEKFPATSALARYATVRSPLDLGPWPSLVRPGGRVAYVPTAALLVRREALGAGTPGAGTPGAGTPGAGTPGRGTSRGGPFDPALRYGEDVDLVWRMLDGGWSVRYEPAAVVRHDEPGRLRPWLARRFHYGSAAGPLARRHPERLAPVVIHPRSAGVLALGLAAIAAWPRAPAAPHPRPAPTATHSRPAPATADRPQAPAPRATTTAAATAAAAHVGLAARDLSRHHLPVSTAAGLALRGLGESAAALGRAATMLAPGVLAGGLLHRRTRRPAAAVLLASPVHEYLRLRPALDPLRFMALCVADDVAYGAGVWAGSIRARTLRPLRPRIARGGSSERC